MRAGAPPHGLLTTDAAIAQTRYYSPRRLFGAAVCHREARSNMAEIPLRPDQRPSPRVLTRALSTLLGDRYAVMLLGGHAAISYPLEQVPWWMGGALPAIVAKGTYAALRVRVKTRGEHPTLVTRPLVPAALGLVLAAPLAFWVRRLLPIPARTRTAIVIAGVIITAFALIRTIVGLLHARRLERAVENAVASPAFDEALAQRDEDEDDVAVEPTLWEIIRDTFFTFDRRTLGFARILLGLLLVGDLFRRTWSWEDMYSTKGVLPNHVNLFRSGGNFSILNAFSSAGELWVLWAVMLVTFVCVLVGYKTRVAQVLALVWVTSLDGRVLLIENGGYVVYNLLLLWTCFLPMGDRFSVDALLASMRRTRERTIAALNDRANIVEPKRLAPHLTLLGFVLTLQLAAIYFFNVVHKTGPAWHNGTAVHYVMYVDRMVNPIIGITRDHIPNWGYQALTRFTIAAETLIPFCLFAPVFRPWGRRIGIVLINALHIGFGASMVLGPFAWALCVFSTLLFTKEDWQIAIATMRRARRARVVAFDAGSGGSMLAARILKRMDRFELLTFRASETGRFYVEAPGPDGVVRLTGSRAVADTIAALPLGPCIAWIFRLPYVRDAVDALVAWLDRGRVTSFFGLHVEGPVVTGGGSTFGAVGTGTLAFARELGIIVMLAAALNQAATELWVINRRWHPAHPEPMRILAHKLRFLQGWFMFSPNPVMDDGTIVVDAVTIDGRHVDPFTRKPPNFDLLHAKSFGYSQIWSDYYNRMHLPANTAYRDSMKDYMFRLPERTGNPNDAIVSGDVYWVQDLNPRWGEIESYKFERNKLFSFENPSVKAAMPPADRPPTPTPTPTPATPDTSRPEHQSPDVARGERPALDPPKPETPGP